MPRDRWTASGNHDATVINLLNVAQIGGHPFAPLALRVCTDSVSADVCSGVIEYMGAQQTNAPGSLSFQMPADSPPVWMTNTHWNFMACITREGIRTHCRCFDVAGRLDLGLMTFEGIEDARLSGTGKVVTLAVDDTVTAWTHERAPSTGTHADLPGFCLADGRFHIAKKTLKVRGKRHAVIHDVRSDRQVHIPSQGVAVLGAFAGRENQMVLVDSGGGVPESPRTA